MARGREAQQHRRRLATLRRAHEQPVLTTNGNPLHLSFRRVVVDVQIAFLGITHQRAPVPLRVPQRLRYRTLGQHLVALLVEIVKSAMDRKEISTSETPSLVATVIFAIYQVEIRRWVSSDKLHIRGGLNSLRRQLQLLITGLSRRRRP